MSDLVPVIVGFVVAMAIVVGIVVLVVRSMSGRYAPYHAWMQGVFGPLGFRRGDSFLTQFQLTGQHRGRHVQITVAPGNARRAGVFTIRTAASVARLFTIAQNAFAQEAAQTVLGMHTYREPPPGLRVGTDDDRFAHAFFGSEAGARGLELARRLSMHRCEIVVSNGSVGFNLHGDMQSVVTTPLAAAWLDEVDELAKVVEVLEQRLRHPPPAGPGAYRQG